MCACASPSWVKDVESEVQTSVSVTCKYGNLFFPCFYMLLVTVI
jgi:hypothetical protein